MLVFFLNWKRKQQKRSRNKIGHVQKTFLYRTTLDDVLPAEDLYTIYTIWARNKNVCHSNKTGSNELEVLKASKELSIWKKDVNLLLKRCLMPKM